MHFSTFLPHLLAILLTCSAVSAEYCTDLKFYYYSQSNPRSPQMFTADNFQSGLESTSFNASKQLMVLTHGWEGSYSGDVMVKIRDELLKCHDVNLLILDWSAKSNGFYPMARNAMPDVGRCLGECMNKLIDTMRYSDTNIHLVGISLGAHACGVAGNIAKGRILQIVGLDDAGVLEGSDLTELLDPSDARCVHSIHTNAGTWGTTRSSGYANFYPNGGEIQPGCSMPMCSHKKSGHFYAESLCTKQFVAHLCNSWSAYTNNQCAENYTAVMGGFDISCGVRGKYYLKTNEEHPYARAS